MGVRPSRCKIDNADALDRAFFHAEAAADAERLGYHREYAVFLDYYALLTHPVRRADFHAYIAASFLDADISVYDCYSCNHRFDLPV